MDNFENFLPQSSEKKKIPYDNEPIYRPSNRSMGRTSSGEVVKTNKLLSVLVSLLCVTTIVFAALFGVLFKRSKSGYSLSGGYPTSSNRNQQVVNNGTITDTAVNLAIRSVVSIEAHGSDGYNMGSGVIVDDTNGYVTLITNYHVVFYTKTKTIAPNIYIWLYDYINIDGNKTLYEEHKIVCDFVGGSYTNDIAVIRFERSGDAESLYVKSGAKPAVRANSADISFDDQVIAIGNPGGYGINTTRGTISKPNYTVYVCVKGDQYPYSTLHCMQIDAAINGGNSGGGLFNNNGELIGIVNAKSRDVTKLENTAFAIPINTAYGVAWNIIENYNESSGKGTLKVADLKCTFTRESYIVIDSTTGAIEYKYKISVKSVNFGKAYSAGLKNNDIIVKMNFSYETNSGNVVSDEVYVNSAYAIEELMFYMLNNAKLTFVVERAGSQVVLSPITIEAADLLNVD